MKHYRRLLCFVLLPALVPGTAPFQIPVQELDAGEPTGISVE